MRIGIFDTDTPSFDSLDEVIARIAAAEQDGLASYWLWHAVNRDALTVLAVAGREVPRIELGSNVVATYPRHPLALAQQAITTAEACGGRLTLGIGASHKPTVEQRFGLSFDRPVAYHRDYLDVLMPVLAGDEAAKTDGMVRGMGGVNRKDLQAVPVLLAALGPAMLQLAGAKTAGTTTWMVGPRTLGEHVVPTIAAAAAAAGMASPRVVAGVPILVTDDVAGGRALARTTFAGYGTRPSYRSSLAREGWSEGGEAAEVGDEAMVTAALAEYAAAGVTDLAAVEFGTDPDDRARTRAVLVALAG